MNFKIVLILNFITFFSTRLESQQTVFYNWLRYNQQKSLPVYESRDYWAGIGFVETDNSYIMPYQTSDYYDGEGGFFVLNKDGSLDSVLLYEIHKPNIIFNDMIDILKINSNRYFLSRFYKDTSLGLNGGVIEYSFIDSNFNVIKKINFYNNKLIAHEGSYIDFDKSNIIVKMFKYVQNTNGIGYYAENNIYRIDSTGLINKIYTNKGRGGNSIREFSLDTIDSTYVFSTTNDIYTTDIYNNNDTFQFIKMKPNGDIVWKYEWVEFKTKYYVDVARPNILIDKTGYKFFMQFYGVDSGTILLYHINRDGKSHKKLISYDTAVNGMWDRHEYILPHNNESHYSFGHSLGIESEGVFDTQRNRITNNFNIHFSKIDTLGKVIWTRRHNTNNPNIYYMRDWRTLRYVRRVEDGGYILYGDANGIFQNLPNNQSNNYVIVIKTDSCGFGPRDTCKVVPRIDSIRFNTAYLSLDEFNYKVCGRRWYVDGKLITSDKLIYSFSDTGTYNIGIWGFAGATTDSTNIQVRIAKLDSCNSNKTEKCIMSGNISKQLCENVSFSIDKTNSKYCNRYWIIQGSKYYQDTVTYKFPAKLNYTVYLVGTKALDNDTFIIPVSVTCISSINDKDIQEVNIYPNPVKERLNLKRSGFDKIDYEIYDLVGKKLLSGLTREDIDVSVLREGVYLIHISTKDGNLIKKFEIKR